LNFFFINPSLGSSDFSDCQGVKCITEIRWSGRGEAVGVVKKRFSKILSALEKLAGEDENTTTRADVGVLLVALQSFSFLCFLGLWLPVLLEINRTQTYSTPNDLAYKNVM